MNTKVKLNEEELQEIWSAIAWFIKTYPDNGATQTKKAMNKIIKKIRGAK